MSADGTSRTSESVTRRIPPLNLDEEERDMLESCVTMMEDNITVECEGEESVEVFNRLKKKVYGL